MELLLDEVVRGVERGAPALSTRRGPKHVPLRFEVLRERLASGRAHRLLRRLRADWLLRRFRAALERPLRVTDDGGAWLREPLGRGLALPALRDGEELGDALGELRELLGEARDQGPQLGVLAEQLLAEGALLGVLPQ